MKVSRTARQQMDKIKEMYSKLEGYAVPTDEDIIDIAVEEFFKSVKGMYLREYKGK